MSGFLRPLLYAVLAMVCIPALAERHAGAVTGKVRDAQGQPLVGAMVTLSSVEDGLKLGTTASGENGKYRFDGVDDGRYRLSAAMAGYEESAIATATLQGEEVAVDFTLRPVLAGPGDGFVGSASDGLSFRASGVEGNTAPSGYSAGASADDAATVITGVSSLEGPGVSLEPTTAKIPDCNQESILIDAVHSHPASFEANRQLGVFYFEHSDMKQAAAYLEQALAIEPLATEDARRLALAYMRTNQSAKAIAAMQATVTRNSDDPAARLRLAQIYQASGDRPRAIAEYVAAARSDLGVENTFACGLGLLSLGAVDAALHLFSQATGDHAASARLWMGLGIAQSLSSRRAESVRSLLHAADLDPAYMPTWFFLAALQGSATSIDEEIRRRLATLVVSDSGSAEAHYDYALALRKHSRQDPSPQLTDQIEAQLSLAIARNPAFSAAHLQLGMVYEEAGDDRHAVGELLQAVQQDPDNAAAHYHLARAYRRTSQAALADRELARFKAMRSEEPSEAETTEASLHTYAAQITRPQQRGAPCPEHR